MDSHPRHDVSSTGSTARSRFGRGERSAKGSPAGLSPLPQGYQSVFLLAYHGSSKVDAPRWRRGSQTISLYHYCALELGAEYQDGLNRHWWLETPVAYQALMQVQSLILLSYHSYHETSKLLSTTDRPSAQRSMSIVHLGHCRPPSSIISAPSL